MQNGIDVSKETCAWQPRLQDSSIPSAISSQSTDRHVDRSAGGHG